MRRALAGKACCRSRGNDAVDVADNVLFVLASTEPRKSARSDALRHDLVLLVCEASTEPCKSARSDVWLTPKLVCQHALPRSRVNLHGVTAYDVLAAVRRHKLQRSRANLHGVTHNPITFNGIEMMLQRSRANLHGVTLMRKHGRKKGHRASTEPCKSARSNPATTQEAR